MQITDINFGTLLVSISIIILCVGVYNTISTAISNRNDQKKIKNAPIKEMSDRLDQHDKMLQSDKLRIENLESAVSDANKATQRVNDGLMTLMRASLAMTRHMRDGNNINGLKDSEQEITDYLTGR